MSWQPLRSTTSTIDIYIRLAQYPLLADPIRARMRQEIFKRGIVDETAFEAEVEQSAIESQHREGLLDPYHSEPVSIWHERKRRIRAFHTDFYFGYNLPLELLDRIILEVLQEQPEPVAGPELAFDPELAPWSLLFNQGKAYEEMAPAKREKFSHHLEQIKVVLIKGMISDHLPYIAVAKQMFIIDDLRDIYERRIGSGKIGGKAAGMLLAFKILQRYSDGENSDIFQHVAIPESYFLGTDPFYEFHDINKMEPFLNQKYRPLDEIRSEYPRIVEAHLRGKFPAHVVEELREVLRYLKDWPIIVRSSSLLEDAFGHAFAGKYQSHFCPNQGTDKQNLADLLTAIRRVYASALSPDALLYRKRHNLLDYDERMAILIQPVRGHRYGRFFFPTVAGVGYSKNPFRWHPKISREDGFLRLVWGMGTRAVNRVSDDYPRTIALSHPTLRPETTAHAICRYSQHYADVIDLEANEEKTLSIRKVLDLNYPHLRCVASLNKGDYIQDILSVGGLRSTRDLVITFDTLLKDHNFVNLMRSVLRTLETAYETPVDIEFTIEISHRHPLRDYTLNLLQCRPLSVRTDQEAVSIPSDLPPEDVIFTTYGLVPDGEIAGIRYLVFVEPVKYREISAAATKLEIGRAIGRLNKVLEGDTFVLIGPGRWGSANIDLGVRVGYADIYNTKALIEMSVAGTDGFPELSYGTHFFQDLIEGGIYSLPLHLQHPKSRFNWAFFHDAPNVLSDLSPQDASLNDYLKVVDVATVHQNRRLTILMDGSNDEAAGYLQTGGWSEKDTATAEPHPQNRANTP